MIELEATEAIGHAVEPWKPIRRNVIDDDAFGRFVVMWFVAFGSEYLRSFILGTPFLFGRCVRLGG